MSPVKTTYTSETITVKLQLHIKNYTLADAPYLTDGENWEILEEAFLLVVLPTEQGKEVCGIFIQGR